MARKKKMVIIFSSIGAFLVAVEIAAVVCVLVFVKIRQFHILYNS